MSFDGFGAGARNWFLGLEADNSKAYFDAHRPLLDAEIRGPLEQMLNAAAFRNEGQVKLFRPHRDVRFSKDKSPYKQPPLAIITPFLAVCPVGISHLNHQVQPVRPDCGNWRRIN